MRTMSQSPRVPATASEPSAWHARVWATLAALRARQRAPLAYAHLVLWLVYLGSYPIAVIGVAFDVRPGFAMAWAGSVLLFVQGALAALWLMLRLGARRGGLLALAVALGAWGGETVGVTTGLPFGPYHYTAILFPRLPGSVPLPVICAWLLVVTTAVAVARRLLPTASRAGQLALAVILGVALDLVLEPVAVRIEHYWIWHAAGPYYGIPTTNFLGWAALCALLAGAVILAWEGGRWPSRGDGGQWPSRGDGGQWPSRGDGGRYWLEAPSARLSAWRRRSPPARTAIPTRDGGFRGGTPLGAVSTARFSPHVRFPGAIATARRLRFPALADGMLWLYLLTLGMFACIDLTHGLWAAAGVGGVTVALLALRARENV
jgi:uncharacterized membrane protein